jgi:hypothetical protein
MHRVLPPKSLLAASIAFGSLVAATGAHAQSNDLISVTVGMALNRVLQGQVHVAPVQAAPQTCKVRYRPTCDARPRRSGRAAGRRRSRRCPEPIRPRSEQPALPLNAAGAALPT